MTSDSLLRLRIVGRAALGGCTVFALTWALLGRPAALGLGLGVGIGTLAFHLRGADAAALPGLTPGAAERRARWGSLARSALRAVTLAVAYLRPEVSFPWAAAGLLALPALLTLGTLARSAYRP